MNPYDFVRIDWSKPPQRQSPTIWERVTKNSWSGTLTGTITTLTPIFVPQGNAPRAAGSALPFQQNTKGDYFISGTSLKGLIRSLIETIAPGCWPLIADSNHLPQAFKRCDKFDKLCPACRLFGTVNGQILFLGRVGFEDAICTKPQPHNAVYTPILDQPKSRHTIWYLDDDQRYVRGRKFYFHHEQITTASEPLKSAKGNILNHYISPLAAQSTFTFTGYFSELADDELKMLIYAMVLEPEMRHKLGYAKPAGFGSVQIQLTRLQRQRALDRYRSLNNTPDTFEGTTLYTFIEKAIAPYSNNRTSITLQDLRRIWQWPPKEHHQYPSREWFSQNPRTPISQTP